MNYTESESSKSKPGGTIDSWCGKCKLILAHTIEAMVGDKPARVHCNTCKSQHTYKANKPGTSSGQARQRKSSDGVVAAQTPRVRASRYQSLLKKSTAAAKSYSSKDRYEAGDILQH